MIPSRMAHIGAAWVLGTAMLACGDSTDEPALAYPVVRNGPRGAWTQESAWILTTSWRKGGPDPDENYVFSGRGLSLAAGPNGQLVVADQEGGSVRVYDRAGDFVRNIGMAGEGPGEWREPLAVNTDIAGQLWLVSFANLRYTVYDTAGHYLRSLPRLAHGFPRLARPGGFDSSGAFLDEIALGGRYGQATFAVARVDTASGEILDTILRLPIPRPRAQELAPGIYRRADPNAPPNPARHFQAHLVIDLTAEGAWVADSRSLRLVRLSLDGDTLLVVETVHRDDLTLSRGEERIIQEELQRRGQSPNESPYGREVIQAVHTLGDGHLLVLIEDEVGVPGHLLDVFGSDGLFLGTLDVGFPVDAESPMASRGDTIFVVGLDELEAKFIARLEIRRRSTSTMQSRR